MSYPLLLATGLPARTANVTNTVGLLTGYAGGALGFRDHLRTQRARLRELAPVALAGGIAGALLLLVTSESTFKSIVPALILGACLLFAFQPAVRRRVVARRQQRATGAPHDPRARLNAFALGLVFAAAVYGGYFGAGIGVILLAILGVVLDDPLPSVNGLRGVLSLLINAVAAIVFVLGADVDWGTAGILSATCLVGGYVGARVSLRMPDHVLRIAVIAFGLAAVAKLVLT